MQHSKSTRRFDVTVLSAIVVFVLCAIGSGGAAQAAKSLPEFSPEGLKLVPKTKVSALYLREGANFSEYDELAILDCYVAFRKHWQRDQNRGRPAKVSDSDVMRVKTYLADELKKVFAEQLTAKGETMATADGPGVLILRPAIINLDVGAPDTMEPGSRTFSASAGEATLFLELYDSTTGELLARALDVETAGDRGHVGVRNGVTNRADADRMLKKWANLLGNFLQNARASTSVRAQ
jgi:hypothetical protein